MTRPNRYQRGEANTDVEFTLRIPAEQPGRFDSDHPDFVTPARARLIRLEIEADRVAAAVAAALDEELPEGAKEGSGDLAASLAAEPPAVTPGRGPDRARYPHPERGPDRASGRPAPAPRYAKPCGFWTAEEGHCGATPTRRYLVGPRCESHAPPAPATADPARTAAALRRRHELAMRGLRSGAARNAARVLNALAHVA